MRGYSPHLSTKKPLEVFFHRLGAVERTSRGGMRVAVPFEIVPGETRVALVPDVVPQLLKIGHTVAVQAGAGTRAGFHDDAYAAAGATIESDARALYQGSQMLLKVQRPSASEDGNEVSMIEPNAVLIGLLQPSGDPEIFAALAERQITACTMELVPRTTRAQNASTSAGFCSRAFESREPSRGTPNSKFVPSLP